MNNGRVWYRLLAGTGAVALASAATFALLGGASDPTDDDVRVQAKVVSAGVVKPLVVPRAPVESEPVEAVRAEPAEPGADAGLTLSAPDEASGWDEVPFTATWTSDDGAPVHGTLDLQRVDGDTWASVAEIEMADDGGSAEVKVGKTGIYRAAYGGSDGTEAVASNHVAVVAGDLLPSRITATAAPTDDGMAEVVATWTTDGGVAIIGDLELQERHDGEWETVSTVTTGADSKAVAEVEAETGARYRFTYDGGSRFAPVRSDAATVVDEDVRSIGVSTCQTSTDIDVLGYGTACHYTPVSAGTFVVAHDYLGNAWWNAMPMGTMVELEGELGGLYEVVEREIAPGRGSALGPASNWTCGSECDVILQTCQGSNTGFTWLREVRD